MVKSNLTYHSTSPQFLSPNGSSAIGCSHSPVALFLATSFGKRNNIWTRCSVSFEGDETKLGKIWFLPNKVVINRTFYISWLQGQSKADKGPESVSEMSWSIRSQLQSIIICSKLPAAVRFTEELQYTKWTLLLRDYGAHPIKGLYLPYDHLELSLIQNRNVVH